MIERGLRYRRRVTAAGMEEELVIAERALLFDERPVRGANLLSPGSQFRVGLSWGFWSTLGFLAVAAVFGVLA